MTVKTILFKLSVHILQLIGLTFSLVCSNLITNKIKSWSTTIPTPKTVTVPTKAPSIGNVASPNDCDWAFGCHHNVCWRGCDDEPTKINQKGLPTTIADAAKLPKAWCFTTSDKEKKITTITVTMLTNAHHVGRALANASVTTQTIQKRFVVYKKK